MPIQTIKTRFGDSQPRNGVIQPFDPPAFTKVYYPHPAHCKPPVAKVREMLRRRHYCFANTESGENDYIMDRNTDSDLANLTLMFVPINDENSLALDNIEIPLDDIPLTNDAHEAAKSVPTPISMTPMDLGEGEGETLEEFKMPLLQTQELELESSSIDDHQSSPTSMDTENGTGAFIAPPNAPPLLPAMSSVIERVWVAEADLKEVLVKDGAFKITREELKSFPPGSGQWLHDSVVDYYLELIVRRNNAEGKSYPRVYSFKSTFYPLLASASGIEKTKDTAEGVNIFDYPLILFPVCQNDHWRLVVANVKEWTVTPYNSISSSPDKLIVKNIVRYLNQEYKHRLELEKRDGPTPMWIPVMDLDLPRQDNADDCGVFMLQFAEYLSRGCEPPFDFESKHMHYFRCRMLYECLSQSLTIA